MKLITRDIDYAVRALCFISKKENGRMVSVSDLVKELKTPRPFLRKILQLLSKKGIVQSHKGNAGGFKLGISPDKIYLADIMEAFHGPVKLNECIFKKRICPNINECMFRRKISGLERYVISKLESITIKSLLH